MFSAIKVSVLSILILVLPMTFAQAGQKKATTAVVNMMDELDPYAADIQATLEQLDKNYEQETGKSAHLPKSKLTSRAGGCYRMDCPVYALVDKASQKMYLYEYGQLRGNWYVSTGAEGHGTPDFDTHPDGRIYDKYTSSKYPNGDYNGLGNMPYAVFISGGFAIHGTTPGNWDDLGAPASHGCVRLHPDNGYIFNRMVRQYGVDNVWITVQ